MNSGISAKAILFRVAALLLMLLALTVGLSFVNFGSYNLSVALSIAVIKALLVLAFFMELRHSPRLFWIIAASGVVWMFFLIGGVLSDILTRIPVKIPGL